MGLTLGFNYKNFDVSAFFQGVFGNEVYNLTNYLGEFYNQAQYNKNSTILDAWRPDNTDARYPRLMSSAGLNGNNNYQSSDFWLVNGAFLRMKDFSFGYDFKRLLKNVNWISKASLAISGQNLFTISDAIKYGLDPEESSTERDGYPNERIYAVSLSVGF